MKIIKLIAPLLILSCSPHKTDDIRIVKGDIFSDRSQELDRPTIAIFQLKSPPLLEGLLLNQGRNQIDLDKLKQLRQEQEQFINNATEISPAIEVLYQYKYTLNAIALKIPQNLIEQVNSLSSVQSSEQDFVIERPQTVELPTLSIDFFQKSLSSQNSVDFIGAAKVHQTMTDQRGNKITGQGIRVGIIDTGIDYTHYMLGGSGDPAEYQAIDPTAPAPGIFPNQKVVGGIDLTGDDFDTRSDNPDKKFPKPDLNPIDIGGHGTHVAGSVAGIGDNKNTYSGVAPDAELYAIKVFGAGATSSAIVLAGLEYSVDPNQDQDLSDYLQVLNLSLGSDYGKPDGLYEQAMNRLNKAGISVIAAAGNSGDIPYITGSPAASEGALSVAASIDHTAHNWQFPAVEFSAAERDIVEPKIEAAFTRPLSEIENLEAELYYIGLGTEDLTEEQITELDGKIALMDRGVINFVDKFKTAMQANILAVVMVNNAPGDAFVMGPGNIEQLPIPGLMISKASGDFIKAALKTGNKVKANLTSQKIIENPENIDRITGFSSRGPRAWDSRIKPEVAAPGQRIISAAVGAGSGASQKNGTSMAAPHVAGAVALLAQKFPELTPSELFALLIGTGKILNKSSEQAYSISRQGGGRIQVDLAANSSFLSLPATLSLGDVNIVRNKTIKKELTLKNISKQDINVSAQAISSKMKVHFAQQQIQIPALGEKKVEVYFNINNEFNEPIQELEARLVFTDQQGKIISVPVLAVTKKLSQITSSPIKIHATNSDDAPGSLVELELKNEGFNSGSIYPFNLIYQDKRRVANPDISLIRNATCDLQSAGYRLVENENGQFIEFAMKAYSKLSTWDACEMIVQIDLDNDNKMDLELAGVQADNIAGAANHPFFSGQGHEFFSFLIDYQQAQLIRAQYDQEVLTNTEARLDLIPVVKDIGNMKVFNHSSLGILQLSLAQLNHLDLSKVRFKLALVSHDRELRQADDFLGGDDIWLELNLNQYDAPFLKLPETINLDAGAIKKLELKKGLGSGNLILYAPQNQGVISMQILDRQQLIPEIEYQN